MVSLFLISLAGFTVGLCNLHPVLLPATAVVQSSRKMDVHGTLFRMMTEAVTAKQVDVSGLLEVEL